MIAPTVTSQSDDLGVELFFERNVIRQPNQIQPDDLGVELFFERNVISQPNQIQSPLVRILNYNILQAGIIPEWTDVVVRENADIVLLVESGTETMEQSGSFFNDIQRINSQLPVEDRYDLAGYNGRSSTSGQAVLSRFPIVSFTATPILEFDSGEEYKINHQLLDVVIDFYGLEVNVLVVHFSCCGGGYEPRLKEQETILNYIDDLGDVPIIYGGDFNSNSPEDTDIPKESTLRDEPLDMLLNSSNPKASKIHTFKDVYRELNPHLPGFTFVDTQFQSRLDYIFVNQRLFDYLVNSTLITSYEEAIIGSDHLPMDAVLNFDPENFDFRPPLPVTDFELTIDKTLKTVNMSWTANTETDLQAYNIYRNGTIIATVDSNSTSYEDAPVGTDSIYYYRITPVDTNGNEGVKTNPSFMDFTTGVLTGPSAPKLSIESTVDGIVLNWTVDDDGGTDILYYNIYRAISETDSFVYKFSSEESNTIENDIIAGFDVFIKVSAVTALSLEMQRILLNTDNENLIPILGAGPKSEAKQGRIIKSQSTESPSPSSDTKSDEGDTTFPSEFFILIAVLASFNSIKRRRNKSNLNSELSLTL